MPGVINGGYMSVVKGKRTKSSLEFFWNAYKINDSITQLLIRGFGVKRISRDLKTFTYSAKMTAEDRTKFIDICSKYNIDVESEYPLWLVEYYRNWILHLCRELINNITQANSVYASSEAEFNLRRRYQWMAIGTCYQLLQAMQTAIRNLPVNAEKYMPYVDMLQNEIESLKAWKKSDNRILSAIKAKNNPASKDTNP